MNRREFLKDSGLAGLAVTTARPVSFKTRHVIWILNGASRKKDWYQNPQLSPNFARLAREGFVYEESHNDTVSHHGIALSELSTGLERLRDKKYFRSRDAAGMTEASRVLKQFEPRLIICHLTGYDVGHGNHGSARLQTGQYAYEQVCKQTDERLGSLIDFVQRDPYFSTNTAIVVRPEFGRDDEPNMFGELHHSEGFYQSHRSAEIWWGPDFKVGVSKEVKNRIDFAPSLLRLFNLDPSNSHGRVHTDMFRA